MNPVGILLELAIAVVLFRGSRRTAALALLAGVIFLPQSESMNISLGGVNIFGMRLLEMVAAARLILRGELALFQVTRLDKVLFFFLAYSTVIFMLRSDEGVAYQIGLAADGLLCYVPFRIFLADIADMRWLLRAFLWLLVPFTLLVAIESFTLQNPFTAMGGINYGGDWMRDGRIRCQGSFRHCSLLGTLGASFLSLYIAVAALKAERKLGLLGIGLCLFIVWASNSGGPISCVANVVFCWMLWRVRQYMQVIRWMLLAAGVVAATFMEASIFYLPAKISSITGGDGWHRSFLMEVSFRDLGKWWLCGMPLSNTEDWFPYHNFGTGFADITNQFIAYGLAAGLPAMLLFIFLLLVARSAVGQALNFADHSPSADPSIKYFAWGLGSVLIMHIANWFGIIYFDQSYVLWYLHLAMIGSLANQARRDQAIFPEEFEHPSFPDEAAEVSGAAP